MQRAGNNLIGLNWGVGTATILLGNLATAQECVCSSVASRRRPLPYSHLDSNQELSTKKNIAQEMRKTMSTAKITATIPH